MSSLTCVIKNAPYCIALCLGFLAGCSPPSDLTGDLRAPTSGSLAVTILGLPQGTPSAVSVTSAQGYHQSLSASQTLSGLAPGVYTVAALEVSVGEDRYGAAPAAQNVVVAPGQSPAIAVVGYVAITGRLHVAIDSVPEGSTAQVTVTGPNGFTRTLTDSATLVGLSLGVYSISSTRLLSQGDFFDPEPVAQSVLVAVGGSTPTIAAVKFSRSSGRMAISVSGLPNGQSASIQVSGPNGYGTAVTGSTTLTGLVPGSYTVTAAPVSSGGNGYQVNPAVSAVTITASNRAENVPVAYALATGSLQLLVTGLPGGAAASVTVTGPQGYSAAIPASTLLTGLVPGDYSIAAVSVNPSGMVYLAAPALQVVSVSANPTAEIRSVSYSPGEATLNVAIGGLPGGVAGSVTVTGPGGYQQALGVSATLSGLTPGTYTLSAVRVTSAGTDYDPAPATQSFGLAAGATSGASVTYSAVTPATGSLSLAIIGLPGGVNAQVLVSGPGGYNHPMSGSELLSGLTPGTYSVGASNVAAGGVTYAPSPVSQSYSVTAGATTSAGINYSATGGGTGSLSIPITGLPGGTNAAALVSGPGGYSHPMSGSELLSGLTPGTYTVSASNVVAGGVTYAPSPASQAYPVTAGTTTSAGINYSVTGGGASLNLRVDAVYLTQATQSYDGSVPLVAGRDAYLRAFALANQTNASQPQVRVRLYSGSSLLQTYMIAAPGAGVPTSVSEATLAASWNILVPGSLVQPGLRVLADVDPGNGIPESDESDNQFPASGASAGVEVRALPVFALRFVPVLQQANGLQGNVTDANKEVFLTDTKAMLPVGAYDADVRAVYTTTAPALQSGNGNGAWGTILNEVLALRSADASTRYYYGVVKTAYGSGVVGMGYVGGGARTSIGWDVISNAPHTMAHELGHNMGRPHAPCGGPASPDPGYPYSGGVIGMWGLDVSTLTVKATSLPDLMSYCQPNWISDYNWKLMINYRQSGPNNAPAALAAGSGTGLLVWGRITAGGIVLEPAFRVASSPDLLPAPGPHRVELLAADGAVLRSVAFEASEVADLPGGSERHFAFVLPVDAATEPAVAGLRVRSAGRLATRIASPAAAVTEPLPELARVNAQQVQVRWDATAYPMVMVKDAATGEVLSFARGGAARLWSRSGNFQLIFSDGVRSVSRTGRIVQ